MKGLILAVGCGVAVGGVLSVSGEQRQERVQIEVFPSVSRIIGNEAELDRKRYFSLCDPGADFRRRCRDDKRYEYLKNQGITFGRKLGVVSAAVKYSKAVREDAARPGFVDVDYFVGKMAETSNEPDAVMVKDFGRLDIAAHGNHNGFPGFMGRYATGPSSEGDKPEHLPENLDAAAELSAYVLKYNFNEFSRPVFYEPVNEPHWSFYQDNHLATWHLKTMDKVHALVPGVKVGGPCSAVGYFYNKGYQQFNTFASFIDATECRLDFYSYHAYDYYREGKGDFGGRISSGLPCESVVDLVQNYTMNRYGREVDLVFSEHGGYESGETYTKKLGKKIPGSGFKSTMKRRSIGNYNMLSSAIANTMSFMNNPHVVRKAVPFILLESMAWDPEYYATLYTPENFKDMDRWVPSRLIDYYRFFKGVEGRYVKIFCPDPDIQSIAFVQDAKLYIVLNNLSNKAAPVELNVKAAPAMEIRRLGRNLDFTPYFSERRLDGLDELVVQGREAMVLMLDYKATVPVKQTVVEAPYYGDRTGISVVGKEAFVVNVPLDRAVDYAVLRVGISRPHDAGHEVEVSLNGRLLSIPLEDCAGRLTEKEGAYASMKTARLDPSLLEEQNVVEVRFPDGKPGAVGAVVIRAAHVQE